MTAVTNAKASKKRRLSVSPLASSALADSQSSSRANFYKEVGLTFMMICLFSYIIFVSLTVDQDHISV